MFFENPSIYQNCQQKFPKFKQKNFPVNIITVNNDLFYVICMSSSVARTSLGYRP